MKKVFLLATIAASLVFYSCNNKRSGDFGKTNNHVPPISKEDPTPEVKPVSISTTLLGLPATEVYVGELKENKLLDGGYDGSNKYSGCFEITVHTTDTAGLKLKITVTASAEDVFEPKVKFNYATGEVAALKKLWLDVKKSKAEDIEVTIDGKGEIVAIRLNSITKKGNTGMVGEIISPERVIWEKK